MSDTLRCAAENLGIQARGIGSRLNPIARFRAGVRRHQQPGRPVPSSVGGPQRGRVVGEGPLWVVLGDSASQGIGASTPFDGWVGQVQQRSGADGPPWRVVNLSVSGARVHDVLDEQLPRLYRLGQPVDLVTCAIGGNDMYRSTSWQIRERFTRLVRSLPGPGDLAEGSRTVLTTLPQGLGRRRAGIANAIVRTAGTRIAGSRSPTCGPPPARRGRASTPRTSSIPTTSATGSGPGRSCRSSSRALTVQPARRAPL